MLNGILKLEDVARQILNPLEMQEFLAARTKDLANAEREWSPNAGSDESEDEDVEDVDPAAVVEEESEEEEYWEWIEEEGDPNAEDNEGDVMVCRSITISS